MRPAPRRHCTLRDYLEIEEASPNVKHELVDGEIFAMAGGSVEHAALSAALVVTLGQALGRGSCRVYSSDLRIRIASANVATYADAAVVCDPVERDPESPTHATNPRVVCEVLSPSTAAYDRGDKRGYYQELASLREYVLVAQDARAIDVWHREGDGWQHTHYGAGERAALPSLGLAIDVDELYGLAGL